MLITINQLTLVDNQKNRDYNFQPLHNHSKVSIVVGKPHEYKPDRVIQLKQANPTTLSSSIHSF